MNEIRRLIADASRNLAQNSCSARLDAELLLMHVLQCSRTWLYAHRDAEPTPEQRQNFANLLDQRRQGKPIAYLIGHKEFWSLDLLVNGHTLIPRPETELLVELTLQTAAHLPQAHILELGTGSGAISLALARERPNWIIDASDVSIDALEIAKTNAHRLQVQNVTFIESHWFSALDPLSSYDMIISNPPYIRNEDPHLLRGDVRFEPLLALTSGKDGLDAIRQIIKQSPLFLKPEGWLLFEHGHDQKEAIRALLEQEKFHSCHCWQDISGNDRVSGGQQKRD